MSGNPYLISIVECSKIYSLPRDKLYAELRKGNTEIPFIKINGINKIHVQLLEKLLSEKALNHEELF